MVTEQIYGRAQWLGLAAFVFGILGLFFYWWTPLGMVLSLTGLVTGWVGWLNAVPRTRQRGLAIAGTILSAVAFILDLVVALLGLELIQLMPYR